MDIPTAIAAHKTEYLDHPRHTFQTWDKEFGQIYRKLPPGDLTPEILLATLLAIPDDTRQRKRAARSLQALANVAKIDINLSKHSGRYTTTKTKARILPSDEAIATLYDQINHSQWRWAYGAIATYGLRPHEVMFLRINEDGTAHVTEGKTGPRQIWPYLPEWHYQFSLHSPRRPNININRNYESIGRAVCKAIARYCHFPAYNLRHAWAVRVMDLGLKDNLAAAQMGHSVEIHQRIYQHWISEREHTAAFQEILKNRSPRR